MEMTELVPEANKPNGEENEAFHTRGINANCQNQSQSSSVSLIFTAHWPRTLSLQTNTAQENVFRRND